MPILPPAPDDCLLAVHLPPGNDKGPIIMEHVLSALYGLNTKVSFEWWHDQQLIWMRIYCHRRHRRFISHQLEAHYPGIQIQEEKISSQFSTMRSVYLKLQTVPVFPIRRYPQTSDPMQRTWTDPYLSIIAALHNVSGAEKRGIQIIFAPAPLSWRKKGSECLAVYEMLSSIRLLKRAWLIRKLLVQISYDHALLRAMFLRFVRHRGYVPHKIDHRSHFQESVVEAAQSKLAQLSFSVTIRLIVNDCPSPDMALAELGSSFTQFNIPELNGFIIRKTKSREADVIGRVIRYPMILSIEELAGVLALPTSEVKTPTLSRVAFRHLPYIAACDSHNGIVVGTSQQHGREIQLRLPRKTVYKHAAIIGKTGSGKSTWLRNIIRHMVACQYGVGLFDPHGDLFNTLLDEMTAERMNDTVVIDATDQEYPLAFNVLQASAKRRDLVVSSVVDTFHTLFSDSWGPRTEYVLSHSVAALSYVPRASLLAIPRFLLESDYRKECLRFLKDPLLTEFWHKEYKAMPARLRMETIAPILNKVNRFLMVPLMRNILGQQENRISLRNAMDDKSVVLVNLCKGVLGEENSRLLGNFLLAHLQIAALSRADAVLSDRPRFTVFVDELQHFTQSASSHIATLLAEGRKYRVNLMLACQHLGQFRELLPTLFGNINTLVVFQAGHDDAAKICGYLGEITPTDIINLPAHHAYIRFSHAGTPHVMSFKNQLHDREATKTGLRDRIRELSRRKFARPKQEVEAEIGRFFRPCVPIP